MLLAIGGLVVLFWVGIVSGRGGLVGTSLLVLVAGSVFGHAFFNIPGGPVPITSDRLLLVVLCAQYVVYRRWGWADPKPLARTDYLLGAFLLTVLFSTITHDFRAHRMAPLSQYIFFFLMPAAMYWIARQTEWTERSARWLFGALGVFGIYLALTAVAENRGAWAFVFPRYIASPQFEEFFGRARGPFLNPAANGIFMGTGLCAALMFWPSINRQTKLVWLGLVPLFALGVYCTLTRSAWMGFGLALMTVLALSLPRVWRPMVLGSAAVAAALVLIVGWDSLMTFKRDKDLDASLTAESAKLRPILATVAWHMFLDRPLLGCGYGQYLEECRPYLSDRSTDLPLEKVRPFVQHNVLLALLAETGILGMGLYMALLFAWALNAWRLRNERVGPLWPRQMGLLFLATLGGYLVNGMFQDVSIIPMVNMLLFYIAGATTGLSLTSRVLLSTESIDPESRRLDHDTLATAR